MTFDDKCVAHKHTTTGSLLGALNESVVIDKFASGMDFVRNDDAPRDWTTSTFLYSRAITSLIVWARCSYARKGRCEPDTISNCYPYSSRDVLTFENFLANAGC